MSLAEQIGLSIRDKIFNNVVDIFHNIGIELDGDTIINDMAQLSNTGLEATFFIKGLDNVVRKDFNEEVKKAKEQNPDLEVFKVKFKRPNKEVRFYLKVKDVVFNEVL